MQQATVRADQTTTVARFVLPGTGRYFSVTATPVGDFLLVSDGTALVEVRLPAFAPWNSLPDGYVRDDALLHSVSEEIAAYFEGGLVTFSAPLAPSGTSFQMAVWRALADVDYGRTASYGEIAAKIGHPKAARAIGMANHVNPIALVIPCHRVIGARGSLTGYAGGIDLKHVLLQLEAAVCAGSRPKWDTHLHLQG